MDKKSIIYGLLGLSLAISISASLIFSGVLLLVWLYELWEQKKTLKWKASPVETPLVIYFVWGVVVTIIAGSASVRKAFSAQSALLLFFILTHGSNLKNIKSLLSGFLIGCVFAGLLGIVQTGLGMDYYTQFDRYHVPEFITYAPQWVLSMFSLRDGRALGTRSHPLTYAETLMAAFFMLLGLLVMIKQKKIKSISPKLIVVMVLSELVVIGGILLAHGRAVWLGTILGCFVLSGMLAPKKRMIYIFSFLLLAGVVFASSPTLKNRFLSTFSFQQDSSADQQSRSIRFYLWEQALQTSKESPVLGVGIRGVSLHLPKEKINIRRSWSETHNIFLQILLERGIIGLGLFFWILISLLKIIWKSSLNLRWIGLSVFTAFMVVGLTESWTRDKEVALIFWTLMGCLEYFRVHRKNPWANV